MFIYYSGSFIWGPDIDDANKESSMKAENKTTNGGMYDDGHISA